MQRETKAMRSRERDEKTNNNGFLHAGEIHVAIAFGGAAPEWNSKRLRQQHNATHMETQTRPELLLPYLS